MARVPAVSRLAFPAKLAGWAVMLIGGAVGAYHGRGHQLLGFQLLTALGMVHGVELCHQALHHLGFRSRWLNYVMGVLLGLPMFVSFSGYQDAHLMHHKTVGTPGDTEFFEYGNKERHTVYDLMVLLLMPAHYTRVLSFVAKSFLGWDVRLHDVRRARRMRFEYVLFGLVLLSAAYSIMVLHNDVFWRCWAFPLLVFATPLHALIELPEHQGCRRDTSNVYLNTRTIRSGTLMEWFTNGNNFHVEHHLKPYWPIEKLGSLHGVIAHEIQFFELTYFGFYRKFFQNYFRGTREIKTFEVET